MTTMSTANQSAPAEAPKLGTMPSAPPLGSSVLFALERPQHYATPVTPWCLVRHMESSGSAFVDARRTDAIEYCFRMKGDLLGDLKKARHCLDAAIEVLSANSQDHPTL